MIAAGAVVAAAGGVALASIPGADGLISGCYNSTSGLLRVVDTAGAGCTSRETAISWNQTGEKGEPGASGTDGSDGAPGAPGAKGDPGVGDVTAMGSSAYVKCLGVKQGAFTGPVTQPGYEGSVQVEAADHGISSPRDAATGMASGKRQHKPFVFTKSTDKASPRFISALISNETLTNCILKFVRPAADGTIDNYYTVKLTNASVASVDFNKGDARAAAGRLGEYETIGLTYQKIEWLITDGGVLAVDDWTSVE